MKNNWLVIGLAAVVGYFLWKKGTFDTFLPAFGFSAHSVQLTAPSGSIDAIMPMVASGGQGSGNLAPEAPYYSSVPLHYLPPNPIPGPSRWTPISSRLTSSNVNVVGRASLRLPAAKAQTLRTSVEYL